jgi:8-amino-7-oxononanoate synthase
MVDAHLHLLQARMAEQLALDARTGRQRQRPKLSRPNARQVVLNGRTLVNFCSNDYLGLGHHPKVKQAAADAVALQGAGGAASALVSGYQPGHSQLEQALAAFTGREAALVFPCGYMANLAVISTLFGRGDVLYADRLNHASLYDAVGLSRATLRRYRHADVTALTEQLDRTLDHVKGDGLRCVITDGVFSMDGDMAPLAELSAAIVDRAILMVDDAHGIGVVGQQGRGSVAGYGFDQAQVPLLVGAFGKALGGNGAFVAGDGNLIEVLAQRARPYIYTTALAPSSVAAVLMSLDLLQAEPRLQDRLQQNILAFRRQAIQLSLPLIDSQTPIQPLLVGQSEAALVLRDFLMARGFWVQAIRPPTVPDGTARLRITLTATHEPEDIAALIEALALAKAQGLFAGSQTDAMSSLGLGESLKTDDHTERHTQAPQLESSGESSTELLA